MHWSIWPSVFICILGGLLLSELNNYSVRLGDTLRILSAFCWGVHILLIRKTVEFFNFPITIAMSQCFVACLVLIGPMFYFEDPTFNNFLKEMFLNSKMKKNGSKVKNPIKNLPTLKVCGPI